MLMHKSAALLAVSQLLLGGCGHTFAPGPGMSAASFESDKANCHLVAMGMQPDFDFSASGKAKTVAAETAGAALGYAIGTAIRENQIMTDCLVGRGWIIADNGVPPPVASPSPIPVAAAPLAPQGGAQLPPPPVAAEGSEQRSAGIVILPITNDLAFAFRVDPPRGVIVANVDPGSPAAMAGVRFGDVILAWNGMPVLTLDDIGNRFPTSAPGSVLNVEVWRSGAMRSAELTF